MVILWLPAPNGARCGPVTSDCSGTVYSPSAVFSYACVYQWAPSLTTMESGLGAPSA